jgi:hypothetical protein
MKWKKYCTKQGKEVEIENTGSTFGCFTSLPFENCCMETDCIYHNTNFLGVLIAVQLFNRTKPDFSAWPLESCELFITKNVPGKKNYCRPLPSGDAGSQKPRKGFLARIFGSGTTDEDSAIYGNQFKSLRENIKAHNNSIQCLKCRTDILIDFQKIENQIRTNQQIAKNSRNPVIFSPDPSYPKVCKLCKGVICNICAKKALGAKINDSAEIEKLLLKKSMFQSLPEKDKIQTLQMCLSPNDPSTILCPACRNYLLEDIDHITD